MIQVKVPAHRMYCLAFAPAGDRIAVAGEFPEVGIEIRDLPAGPERSASLEIRRVVFSLAFAPDGRTLAAAGGEGLRAWDLLERRVLWAKDSAAFTVAGYSPDGSRLAVIEHNRGNPGEVASVVLEAQTGRERARLSYPIAELGGIPTWGFALSPDGSMLAVGLTQTRLALWRIRDAEGPRDCPAGRAREPGLRVVVLSDESPVYFEQLFCAGSNCLAFSPDRSTLAVGAGKHILICDAADGRLLRTHQSRPRDLRGLVFTPDGRTLVAIRGNGTAGHLDPETGVVRATLDLGFRPPTCLAVSPDGSLAAAGGAGYLTLWDLDAST